MPPAPQRRVGDPTTPRESRTGPNTLSEKRPATTALELAGLAVALVLALAALWHMVATARAWILFYDADSVLPALIHNSLTAGQPQDWSLSAVLFLPETTLYLAISSVVADTRTALALNGILNFLLLYGVLRLGTRLCVPWATRARQVGGAVLAFTALAALTLLDSSGRWDGAELPSLLATTTYYSATVLAMLLTPPLVALTATRGSRWGGRPALALTGLAAVSTLTNPLYLGWTLIPLSVVLLLTWGRRLVALRGAGVAIGAIATGGLLGLLLRVPLAGSIPRDSGTYAEPGQPCTCSSATTSASRSSAPLRCRARSRCSRS